ncbi:MAG: sodium:alanine symporter family protein [Defluviitaleaceae bacterium]|nr:sodium:alanine symporter family protein [Defluviitaleaceae bacterium]
MQAIEDFFRMIQPYVWGPAAWSVLLGAGLILTIRFKGFQIFKFKYFLDYTIIDTFRKPENKKNPTTGDGDVSPFQASMTSFAATMGVGTLAGTATAIGWGGPGAVFWMWVVGFFGIATKLNETILAVHYRGRNKKGEVLGGPFAYMELGLKQKWLAMFFAFFGTIATFGIGNMVQANSAAIALVHTWPNLNEHRLLIGIVAAIFIGLVIIGGIKSIANTMDKVIPFLALLAIVSSILIVLSNITAVPYAFSVIFRAAFTGQSITGGVAGVSVMYAIRLGLQRGIFSNEAGLGSGPIAYSTAKANHPVKPALWGCFEVFLDTHIMCTLIALVILTQVPMDIIAPSFLEPTLGLTGSPLVIQAYQNSFFGNVFGGWFMSILIATFGFTTIIGWSYVGEKCFEYLLGPVWGLKLRILYRIILLPAAIFGAYGGAAMIWAMADTLNAFMAIPNIIAALLLSGTTVKVLKDYFDGKEYVPYDSEKNA